MSMRSSSTTPPLFFYPLGQGRRLLSGVRLVHFTRFRRDRSGYTIEGALPATALQNLFSQASMVPPAGSLVPVFSAAQAIPPNKSLVPLRPLGPVFRRTLSTRDHVATYRAAGVGGTGRRPIAAQPINHGRRVRRRVGRVIGPSNSVAPPPRPASYDLRLGSQLIPARRKRMKGSMPHRDLQIPRSFDLVSAQVPRHRSPPRTWPRAP